MLVLLFLALVSASHFRGGTVSWTRASPTSRTITANVVMHFYTGGIFPRMWDIRINWGDGTRNSPSRASSFLNGTWDRTGTVRTVIYQEEHTYPELQFYRAYIYSVARQHAIINGPDRPYRVEAGVNLALSSCLGSPAGIIPGVTYLGIRPDASFQIGASTSNAQPLQYSWYDNSYLFVNPPQAPSGAEAALQPASPSYDGVIVNWDTSSGTEGSLYAVSVRADIEGVPNCHAVWDVTVQLEPGSVPECTSGGGSYTLYTSDSASISFGASDGTSGVLNAALIGDLPPGASFSSLDAADSVVMTWSSPVAGSYSFAVQFCNEAGLCGACSAAINVNDALPRIVITSVATPSEDGSFSFETLVENTSLDQSDVVVQSVASSKDGDLTQYGCTTGDVITADGRYNCTYTSPSVASPEDQNVISVEVVAGGDGPVQSVAGASVDPVYPATTTTAAPTVAPGQSTTTQGYTTAPLATTGTGPDGSTTTALTAPALVTISPVLIPQGCGTQGVARCSSDADCGNVDGTQAGLCSSNGFCQCGIGFQGIGTNLDPVGCEFVCTPPAVPDAVAFLHEPILDSYADSGDMVVRVSIDPYLKQRPATIAMLHPVTFERCGILPEKLGLCELTQEVNPGNCWTEYQWRRSTFMDVVSNSGCFVELPNVTETGPGFTVLSRSFRTIFEVDLVGEAPFGLNATKKRSETTVQRTLRREYTYTVATQYIVESNPFSVVADGLLRYRLVEIDYRPSQGHVLAVIQTRVAKGGSVSPLRVSSALSSGLSLGNQQVQPSFCDPNSPDLYCDQYHVVTVLADPCAANGELVLTAGLQCNDPDFVDDPVACGFINVPVGNVYTLDNILIDFDMCPRARTYGLDISQSWIRLYTDATRSVALSAPLTLGSTSFGRISIRAGADSNFLRSTVEELHLFRVNGPTPEDLGDRLGTALLFFPSPQTSTDRVNPVWDFSVDHSDALFDADSSYYWEATIAVVFEQTGELKRHKVRVVPMEREAAQGEPESLTSTVFRFLDERDSTGVQAEVATPTSAGIIAGAVVGGVAVAVGALLAVVLFRKRRKRSKILQSTDVPDTAGDLE